MQRIASRGDCTPRREAADRDAAQEAHGYSLAAIDVAPDPFAVGDLLEIGILFADAFILSCDPPS